MSAKATIDGRVFTQVLQEYSRLMKRKSFPEICNSKALDVAFRALQATPKASAESIRALANKTWWPKYVAKRILGGVSFRGKGKSKITIQGRGYSRADAKRVSAKIIERRLRSVAFEKSGWLPAIQRLSAIVKGRPSRGSIGGARQYGQPKGSVQPAIAGDNPTATIVNSAEGIDRIGAAALQTAVDGAAADMAEYIARKMEEGARRVAR